MNHCEDGGPLCPLFLHDTVNQSLTSSLAVHVQDVKSDIFILWIGLGYTHL